VTPRAQRTFPRVSLSVHRFPHVYLPYFRHAPLTMAAASLCAVVRPPMSQEVCAPLGRPLLRNRMAAPSEVTRDELI
jgi:hypothetical protein